MRTPGTPVAARGTTGSPSTPTATRGTMNQITTSNSKTNFNCSVVNATVSQNPSTASTSPSS